MRNVSLGSLKTGSLVMIDGEPCRVASVDKSKPGKHGAAKIRLVGIGIFDNGKRSLTGPADSMIESPMVSKRTAQIISVADTVQLMDTETYEVFETAMPEEEIRSKLLSGAEVEYWQLAETKKIVRVK
ncbi:MAG: translation initiation factor IF-5A [Candidatus Geothermarchaeales archaeon]